MREKLILNGDAYDNASVDNKVGFIEDTHTYLFVDDKKFKFNSVTTLIKDYEEHKDSMEMATKASKNPNSKYFGQDPNKLVVEWQAKADKASGEGTILHAYGEDLLNEVENIEVPDLPKAKWVPEIVKKLWERDYELAKTELLVYSRDLALAGQSDILLKKKRGDEYEYMIYDWKFLGDKIKTKSFYNPYTRRYKKMFGPFKHLMDCNWIHYSIQLSIYQTLTGNPNAIREKVLVVVYDDGYELVPTYPMRVFWDENLQLQAVYEIYNGKFYDSRTDKLSRTWPSDIEGR